MGLGLVQFSASSAVSQGKHTTERQQVFAESTVLTLGPSELEERRCRHRYSVNLSPCQGRKPKATSCTSRGDCSRYIFKETDSVPSFIGPCLTFVPRPCLLRTNKTLLLKYLTSLHCAKKQVFVDSTGSCVPRACVPLFSCPVCTCCLSEAASPAE